MRRLENEGLLVHEPRQGLVIAKLDHAAVMELYAMREVLEGTAARLAARHASDLEVAQLLELIAIEKKLKAGTQNFPRTTSGFIKLFATLRTTAFCCAR